MTLPLLQLGIRQSQAELIAFHVDGTGTAAIDEGKFHGTLTDNGTGDYTITLNSPGLRQCVVIGAATVTANLQMQVAAISASAIQVVWTNNAGAATDTDFDICILVFRRAEQN